MMKKFEDLLAHQKARKLTNVLHDNNLTPIEFAHHIQALISEVSTLTQDLRRSKKSPHNP